MDSKFVDEYDADGKPIGRIRVFEGDRVQVMDGDRRCFGRVVKLNNRLELQLELPMLESGAEASGIPLAKAAWNKAHHYQYGGWPTPQHDAPAQDGPQARR